MSQSGTQPRRPRVRQVAALSVLVACVACLVAMGNPPDGVKATPPEAAAPPFPHANPGLPNDLAALLPATQKPATGPGSVAAFVDSLSANDAAFEVLVGQSRILTVKADLAVRGKTTALVAVGDPTVADFQVLSARQIRVGGQRIGTTDLSVVTPDGATYSFEVRVVADLNVLRGQLRALFPDAAIRLAQIRDHVVVEGQARDTAQAAKIVEAIEVYLESVLAGEQKKVSGERRDDRGVPPRADAPGDGGPPAALPEGSPIREMQAALAKPKVINLLTVPGSKQVLLKVRVAELNRTAFRQIGSDLLVGKAGGPQLGTRIGGGVVNTAATAAPLAGLTELLSGSATTAFGIFEQADFAVLFSALRRNSLLRVLAEPNLVAMNGHPANFLAGGEFPVPVPQQTGVGGGTGAITVQFREFGVRLAFLPTITDGDVIKLSVNPEVSTIDPALGTTLVAGGSPVPGLSTRRAQTTVELKQGQTLAVAGLLQLTMDGSTQRIPLMGDLPVIGPFFSNTTNGRVEKELIVLVTPYLVEGVDACKVPPLPGDEITTPSDLEFYLHNRIEGKGPDWRATTNYDRQLQLVRARMRLDAAHVRGPHGFCE